MSLFDKINTAVQAHVPAGTHVAFTGFVKPKLGSIALGLEMDVTLPGPLEAVAETILEAVEGGNSPV